MDSGPAGKGYPETLSKAAAGSGLPSCASSPSPYSNGIIAMMKRRIPSIIATGRGRAGWTGDGLLLRREDRLGAARLIKVLGGIIIRVFLK
jgi:hypothetical protein